MKRVMNVAGAALIIAGLAVLAYAGVGYFKGQQAAKTATWSKTDQQKGKLIAAQLTKPQIVKIPKRLAKRLPRPGSEVATRLVIPKINVDAPIVQTAPVNGEWEVADWAVGHLTTTPNPGVSGNMALSAHDDIKGELFKRLDVLKPGDTIQLYTPHARYTYVVFNQQTVDPSDITVLNPTSRPVVSLISCTPYWVDTQRLVVQAALRSRSAV